MPIILTIWNYRKAITIGIAISAILWLYIIVNGWRNDSAKLEDLYVQIQAHNQAQGKADGIAKTLDKTRVEYIAVARKIDATMPSGCSFDSDGVQRTTARIDAGEASRKCIVGMSCPSSAK